MSNFYRSFIFLSLLSGDHVFGLVGPLIEHNVGRESVKDLSLVTIGSRVVGVGP